MERVDQSLDPEYRFRTVDVGGQAGFRPAAIPYGGGKKKLAHHVTYVM